MTKIFSLDDEMKIVSEIQFLVKKKIRLQGKISRLKKGLNKKMKRKKYV